MRNLLIVTNKHIMNANVRKPLYLSQLSSGRICLIINETPLRISAVSKLSYKLISQTSVLSIDTVDADLGDRCCLTDHAGLFKTAVLKSTAADRPRAVYCSYSPYNF